MPLKKNKSFQSKRKGFNIYELYTIYTKTKYIYCIDYLSKQICTTTNTTLFFCCIAEIPTLPQWKMGKIIYPGLQTDHICSDFYLLEHFTSNWTSLQAPLPFASKDMSWALCFSTKATPIVPTKVSTPEDGFIRERETNPNWSNLLTDLLYC